MFYTSQPSYYTRPAAPKWPRAKIPPLFVSVSAQLVIVRASKIYIRIYLFVSPNLFVKDLAVAERVHLAGGQHGGAG